jgi:DHA1 family bicyclomycin/chloramphenicol resistance-like MFS transporter
MANEPQTFPPPDMDKPVLAIIPAVFASDVATVQLTMSLNALAFGAAQLVHGPMADRFGRRPVLLAGMAAFIVCSLACALASSIGGLIAARIFQGLAASSEAVVALAVIRDLYRGNQAVRILSLYGMAIALAPAAGPILGGYMHVAFGWRSNFFLLAVIAVAVTLMTWRFLPESRTPDPGALKPRHVAAGFGRLLRQRVFIGHALMLGAVMAAIYAFITAAPFILIDRYDVATQHFGYYQAVVVLLYVLGSVLANRAVGRLGIETLLRAGLIVTVAGGLAMPVAVAVVESAASLTAAMSLFAFGIGLVFATEPLPGRSRR